MFTDRKVAIKSIGIVAPAFVILVAVLKFFGYDISAEIGDLPQRIADAVDMAIIAAMALAGLWGRAKATTKISGVFKEKE